MSLTFGSRSRGSSGPRPKTSSRMSPRICSRSAMLTGVASSDISSKTSVRISVSARCRSTDASASRLRRLSSLRWTLPFSWVYCGRTSAGRGTAAGPDPDPVVGGLFGPFWGAGAVADMTTSCLAQEAERETECRLALVAGGLVAAITGRNDLAGEAVELRRDLRVVRQGQRHARVERGGHGLVVARKRVVDSVAESGLVLLRRDHVLVGRAVQQNADPLAADAELPDAIDQPLRVAHGRHVGIGDDEDRVVSVKRRDAACVDLVARVDDDVVVRPAEHAEQLLDGAGVLPTGPLELLGAGHDFQARLVLRAELVQEVLVEPVQVLEGIEHREPRAD